MQTIKITNQLDADKLPIILEGNLVIEEKVNISHLKEVGGNLYVDADFKADALTSVGGNLSVYADFKADALTSVGGYLSVYADFKADALTSVGSNLYVDTDFKADALTSVGGYLYVDADFKADALTSVGGDLSVYADFKADALTSVGGYLYVDADFKADALTSVGGNLSVYADFKADALTSVGSNLYVDTDFKADALTSVGGYLYVDADFNFKKFHKNESRLFVKNGLLLTFKDLEYHLFGFVESTLIKVLKLQHSSFQNFYQREFLREWSLKNCTSDLLQRIERDWEKYEPFTAKEIFKIQNLDFRRLCFQYLTPSDIMQMLKAKRICVKGKEMNYYKYVNEKKAPYTKHNIFETYEANASDLDEELTGKIHAVKCWCSTTEKEHWLWIDEKYKNDPLAAIASTFRVHENIIPEIKGLKRQGDILLIEMDKEVIPKGPERGLTEEEYFGLLVCES